MITSTQARALTEATGDEFKERVNKEISNIETKIIAAAQKGESEIYFCYVEGSVPFGNMRIYEAIKKHLIANGFRIVRIGTRFSSSNGGLLEYAKEYIAW